jgi:hypothetical protein
MASSSLSRTATSLMAIVPLSDCRTPTLMGSPEAVPPPEVAVSPPLAAVVAVSPAAVVAADVASELALSSSSSPQAVAARARAARSASARVVPRIIRVSPPTQPLWVRRKVSTGPSRPVAWM